MDFDTLYQELTLSTQMIRALTAGLTTDEARLRPTQESWSVLEVVCHLYDEEREDFRYHLDAILHRPDEEWPAYDPGQWVTDRRYNERELPAAVEAFFAERAQSLAWLKDLAVADWDVAHVNQYGSMSAGEMFASWVAHDNLHIRQLVELRRARVAHLTQPYDIRYAGEW